MMYCVMMAQITSQLNCYISHTRAGLSRKEIVANSIIFVIAGFENSKMLLTFLCYNLAMHEDCQDRLRKEIQEGIAAHDVSRVGGKMKNKVFWPKILIKC